MILRSLLPISAAAALLCACNRPAPPVPVAAPPTPAATTAAAAEAPTPTAATEMPAPTIAGYARPVGPVATVNGKDIPAARFNAEFDALFRAGTRMPADRMQRIAKNVLSKLIDQELRDQAIVANSIALSEAEQEAAWKDFTARFVDVSGHFDEAMFRAELQRARLDEGQLRQQILEQRKQQKLIEKLGEIDVSEPDLKTFYDNNPQAWIEPASRDVRPLLLRAGPDSPPEVRERAAVATTTASEKLRKGGDFEDVARELGLQPLPPIHLVKNSSEPELEAVAFQLKVGEVSQPVQTRWGWYVLRLIEKNEQRLRPFQEVRDEIRATLQARKRVNEDRRIVAELRRKAEIVEKLGF
jgi:hypothetical protein